MADKEDVKVLKALLPVVGIGTAVVVAFAVSVRAFASGRVLEDGQYLVSVRYPGQRQDIRSFVQPYDPDVIAVYKQIGPDPWTLYDFVCRNIDYKLDIGEFWLTPPETLARRLGDCEDTSNLLTSLIRAGGVPNCHVAVGSYQGYGHAWVSHNGQILETTFTSARVVPDPGDYFPYLYFNDLDVIELWPGAMTEVFGLERNEARKLNLIAKAIGNEVPPECPSGWPFMAVGLVTGGILGTGFAMILQKGEKG